MDRIVDSKGAVVNAGTSKDYTHYYIQIPSEHFDLALELHADMLQNPLIPRKELERE
jgi:predicted Zn-dependent peptidase